MHRNMRTVCLLVVAARLIYRSGILMEDRKWRPTTSAICSNRQATDVCHKQYLTYSQQTYHANVEGFSCKCKLIRVTEEYRRPVSTSDEFTFLNHQESWWTRIKFAWAQKLLKFFLHCFSNFDTWGVVWSDSKVQVSYLRQSLVELK
jgi:hypothetical protein